MESRQVQNESGPFGHVWTDFKLDMYDPFSFDSQPVFFPSTAMESKATPWPVDLVPSAETLPRYPQASIASVTLAAGLRQKRSSSEIRKNNYPIKQYTPTKATAHYTISQDCTAGSEVRKMQLLADFGKKCQGGKNHFGHLGNMRLGPDVTYRQTDTTEKKVSEFADSGVGVSHSLSPVGDRTTIRAQQLSQKTAYSPWSRSTDIWVPNRMGKAELSSSKEARGIGTSCRLCGYIPQGDTRRFGDYMAKHMKKQHSEARKTVHCPYPGCTSPFSRLDHLRRHQRRMGHDIKDEDLGMQKRQRTRRFR